MSAHDAAPLRRYPASTLLAMGLSLRALLIATSLRGHGGSLWKAMSISDSLAYVTVARMAVSGVRVTPGWDERVFIGWALTLALPGALFGYEVTCLVLGTVCAALTPVVAYKLTGDRVSSLAAALLTPTWLRESSMGMSECVFMLYQLLAIWACLQRRTALASLAAAAAMIVRPTGAFVWVALAYVMMRRRNWSALAMHCVIAAFAIAFVLAFNQHFYGDALRQAHLYSQLPNIGEDGAAAIARLPHGAGHLGIPFLHLIATPFVLHVPTWKVVYIWLHAVLVVAACVIGVRDWRASASERDTRGSELDAMMLIWAVLNTAFILCTGPYWGFFTFDRYCLWAMPAYLYLARAYLPKRNVLWIALASVSIGLAFWGTARRF